MDFNKINHIIEKYWEGETSLEEEVLLKDYFANEQVNDAHKLYAPLFSVINEQTEIQLPDHFTENLQKQLETETDFQKGKAKVYNLRRIAGLAASVLVIVIATYYLIPGNQTEKNIDLYADTYDTPEEALEGMMWALGTFSEKMDEGTMMMHEELNRLNSVNQFTE